LSTSIDTADQALSRKFCVVDGKPQDIADDDDQNVLQDRTVELNAYARARGLWLPVGCLVDNKYEVVSLLGAGGMGAVYKVRHNQLQKEMALKTFKGSQLSREAWPRFEQEARAIAKLDCVNIVQVFDSGYGPQGVPFYTMELLKGESLADKIRNHGPLSVSQTLSYFHYVAIGLSHAHKAGIVHRDIKPGNIFICDPTPGAVATVKIVDFGIAKLIANQDLESQKLTNLGIIFGSPLYMSPEQSAGFPVDQRSDLYSYGCSLYETLTGKPPFEGKTSLTTMEMHQRQKAPSLNEKLPGGNFDKGLEQLVSRLLAKNPDLRYQTFDQVIEELKIIFKTVSKDPAITSSLKTSNEKPLKPNIAADTLEITEEHKNEPRSRLLSLTLALILISIAIYLFNQNTREPTQKMRKATSDSKSFAAATSAASPKSYCVEHVDGSKVLSFPKGVDLGKLQLTNARIGLNRQPHEALGEIFIAPGTYVHLIAGPQLSENPALFDGFGQDNLQSVTLNFNLDWNSKHLKRLTRFTALLSLEIDDTELDASCFDLLNEMRALRDLSIPECHTKASDILHWKKLGKERQFNADLVANLGPVIEVLSASDSIRDISLQSCKLTDRDLQKLGRIKELERLKIGQNRSITIAGVRALSSLKKLQALDLDGIAYDPKWLTIFKALKSLDFLRITYEPEQKNEIAKLRNQLPLCKIDAKEQIIADDLH